MQEARKGIHLFRKDRLESNYLGVAARGANRGSSVGTTHFPYESGRYFLGRLLARSLFRGQLANSFSGNTRTSLVGCVCFDSIPSEQMTRDLAPPIRPGQLTQSIRSRMVIDSGPPRDKASLTLAQSFRHAQKLHLAPDNSLETDRSWQISPSEAVPQPMAPARLGVSSAESASQHPSSAG